MCLLLFSFSLQSLYSQSQRGRDINGSVAGDLSGFSVSMPDPLHIAIGAPFNFKNGSMSGQVRIFKWNGSAWNQKGKDINGSGPFDQAGYKVCMPDSNTVAIGAPYNDDKAPFAGQIRVFRWVNNQWVQKGNDLPGAKENNQIGLELSMPDSNTIAFSLREGAGIDAGQVRVFKWDGTAWVKKGNEINGIEAGEYFGNSLSMPDPNTLAAGAFLNDKNGENAGQVRIYKWDGISWVQKGLAIDGESARDRSGSAVSMPDSNHIAIGAYENSGSKTHAGHARVFTWDGIVWKQKGKDIDGEGAGDYSGTSVSMPDPNTIAIGAPENNGSADNSGHVRVYIWSQGAWIQSGSDINGQAADDNAGLSVCMPNALTVGFGAHSNNNAGFDAGNARVFSYCPKITDSISPVTCGSFTSPSGRLVWRTSGRYHDTVISVLGCDSVIVVNLSLLPLDAGITLKNDTLFANETDAVYQWIDCDDNNAVISGATNRWYKPLDMGRYAVRVMKNECKDTSDCFSVKTTNDQKIKKGPQPFCYPNPTDGSMHVDLGEIRGHVTIVVRNSCGQKQQVYECKDSQILELPLPGVPGLYFLEIRNGQETSFVKVIKI